MKRFQHPNIVRLLGMCTLDEPLYMVMELMLYGDLRTFLLTRRHLCRTGDSVSVDWAINSSLSMKSQGGWKWKMSWAFNEKLALVFLPLVWLKWGSRLMKVNRKKCMHAITCMSIAAADLEYVVAVLHEPLWLLHDGYEMRFTVAVVDFGYIIERFCPGIFKCYWALFGCCLHTKLRQLLRIFFRFWCCCEGWSDCPSHDKHGVVRGKRTLIPPRPQLHPQVSLWFCIPVWDEEFASADNFWNRLPRVSTGS